MNPTKTETKTVVIVGGVAGGASCATRLRRQSEHMRIIMVERGKYVSFANCGLPYYVGGVIEEQDKLLVADAPLFKDRFNVDVRIEEEVVSIDRESKSVKIRRLSDNAIYDEPYDCLVLSTGSKAIKPPLPGIDLPGIYTIKEIPDTNKVKTWIKDKDVRSAVVIGGGFIGLEMVENLRHLGIDVTLIEKQTQLLPVIDREMAHPIKEPLEKNKVRVLMGESVERFDQKGDGLTLTTSEGNKIDSDLVILAIGVTPENSLAKAAGLQLGSRGHVVVDSNMRTSDRNIFAIGDVIKTRSTIIDQKVAIPLAGPANRQGRIAADVIASRGRFFRGLQGTSICGFFGLTVATTGVTEKTLQNTSIDYGVVYAHPKHHVDYYPGAQEIFIKLLFDKLDGRILGMQAVGTKGVERRVDVVAMAIQMKSTVFDLEEAELCYAPQYGSAKDPVNIIGMIAANVMRGDLVITPWQDFGKDNAVLLDVRDEHEIKSRPVPNSMHIPLDQLRARLEELPKDRPIQINCGVGSRAYNAYRILNQYGFNCSLMSGGTETWFRLQ